MTRHRELRRHLSPGWRIAGTTGGGHLRLAKPGRPVVYTSATPSDHRALKNTLAQVRRVERTKAR